MAFNMGGMNKLMKQFEGMQTKLAATEAENAKREYTGKAGAGLVEVVVTGAYEMKKIVLDPSLTTTNDADDQETLQDLIIAAVNDALNKIKTHTKENMESLRGGMDLGALQNLMK